MKGKITGPYYFWYLNTKMEPAVLKEQLREMRRQNVTHVCPHPWPPEFRPEKMPSDMEPEYLSDQYFERFKIIFNECEKLGITCCLYDEGGWPSGGAGGRVRASDPERFAPRYMTPEGERIEPPRPNWRAPLPNLLVPGVAEKFLELTHERYYKYFPELFGAMIPFAFMDEPRLPACYKDLQIAWAPDLAEVFEKRKGYDLKKWTAELIRGNAPPQVAIDYFDVLSLLFTERFLLPVRSWCRRHNILAGGHFGGEDEPHLSFQHGHGHIMRSLRCMDLPGVDAISRQIFPGKKNLAFPHLASSIARQAGRKYALAEIFAVYGNGLTPEQRCFVADYMQVRGVNLLVFSKYALTCKKHFIFGCRPHLGPVDPLWKYSAAFHHYCRRISEIMTRGKPVVDTAVYFDQRSLWAGEPYRSKAGRCREAAANRLQRRQCDFDFVDDDALARAKIVDGKLVIGAMAYSSLVVPSSRFMHPDAAGTVNKFHSSVPRPLLKCRPAAPQLRVSCRRYGKKYIWLCVNEGTEPLDVKLTLDRSPVLFRDPWGSGDYMLEGRSIEWHFEPCGSAIFISGQKGKKRLPHIRWEDPAALSWQLRALCRHFVGNCDIEMENCRETPVAVALGEWSQFLTAGFSGDACYITEFENTDKSLWLDLGKVHYCASVRLNGKDLGYRFRSPFHFDLTPALKRGKNRLEITVSNTLANALSAPGVEDRVNNCFPPRSPYENSQRSYEQDSLSGGLFGPVRFGKNQQGGSRK